MTAAEEARTYRLAPPDRTGWVFGLSLGQLIVVATGIVIGTLLMVTVSAIVGLGVMVGLCTAGVVRVQGSSLVAMTPHVVRFARGARRGHGEWMVRLPVLGGSDSLAPKALRGLELLVVAAGEFGIGTPGAPIAVSHDRRGGTVAATLRVSGRQFGLTERPDQDWRISQWGSALQAFVREQSPVVSVRWSEWAAPAGLDAHRSWLVGHCAAEPLAGAVASYDELLRDAEARSVRHEVLVTVTLEIGRVRGAKQRSADQLRVAVDELLREIQLFADRLEAAQLTVSSPLGPAEWARAMRLRLDPGSRTVLDGRARSLGTIAGGCTPANALPTATESSWTAWHTDGSWHRAMHVADWPRLDVPAAWMADLLLRADWVRSVAVFFEPVPRSKSQRSITRDAAKIESDASHRAEKGFRVGAHHRRARRAVEEREEELVAGFAEFTFAGVVVITASTLERLDAHTAEVQQVAASVGIDLRPLHGRHDLAMVATLPVARGLVRREWL